MNGIVEILNRAAAAWWEWTVASTGQGALLLLVVVLILAAGRSLRPGLRYGLLLVVLLKFALPPVFGLAYGFSDLLARAFTNEPAPLVDSDLRVTVETAPALAPRPAAVSVATMMPQTPVLSTKAWLLLLEAVGAAVIVFLIARQWLVARTLIWNGTAAEEALQERFHAMARSLKLRRTPRLRLSEAAVAPQSGGILRPFVLLPAWATTMPDEELDILLAHELAHVRRMDALVNGIQAAAQALLWWNPAVWWLNRRIREEREFCCDDLVLSQGVASGAAYSRTLVNVAERVSLPQSSWAMAGMADNFGAIDRRVRRALEGGHAQRGWGRYGALVVLLLVAGWVLPGATDGAEKEFDLIEAAKVETAFHIRDMESEHAGYNADGAQLRTGRFAFVMQSSKPGQPELQMNGTGDFLYPNAAGEAEKCVVTGNLVATYKDMSIAASRIVFGKDGVVDFGNATMNAEGIKELTSERMVLDLRDGTIAMQDGKAEQINVESAETLPNSAPVAEISPSQEPADVEADSLESNAAPIGPIMKIDTSSVKGNIQTGVFTELEDAMITFFSSIEGAEISVQGKHLNFSGMDAANRSGVIEGDMQASRDEFTISAPRLEYGETLLFSNTVLESRDFGTVQAEQIRVDTVARRMDILNGTVDEARLKAAFGDSAKNAARGEWLTLPFAVARQVAIDAMIVEMNRDADFSIPGGPGLAELIAGNILQGDRTQSERQSAMPSETDVETRYAIWAESAVKWSLCKESIHRLVEKNQAKMLSAPMLVTVAGQKASISIGKEVPAGEELGVASSFLGLSLGVLPTLREMKDKSVSIMIEMEFKLTTQGDPVEGTPVESVDELYTKLLLPSGRWLCQVMDQRGERVKLLFLKTDIVGGSGEVSLEK